MEVYIDYAVQLGTALLRFLVFALVVGLCGFWLRSRLPREWLARGIRALFLLLLYAITAAGVLDSFMEQWGFRADNKKFGFEAMTSFTAERPFAYRVLTPILVNAASDAIPDSFVESRRPFLAKTSPLLRYRTPGENWSVEKSLRWHVTYLYLFACLMAVLFAARSLTAAVYTPSPLAAALGPVVGLLFLQISFHYGGYFYDFPQLALDLTGLLLLVRGRWLLFYLVLIAAVLNKESDALLVLYPLAIFWGRTPRRTLALHLAAQTAIVVVLLVVVRLVLRDNPGDAAWFTLPLNLLFWLEPWVYFLFIEPVAPLVPLPRGANVLNLFLVGGLCAWGWRDVPLQIRRLLLVTAAVNLTLLVFFGFFDEIRVLAPVFPALYLVAWSGVRAVWREEPDPAQPHST